MLMGNSQEIQRALSGSQAPSMLKRFILTSAWEVTLRP